MMKMLVKSYFDNDVVHGNDCGNKMSGRRRSRYQMLLSGAVILFAVGSYAF